MYFPFTAWRADKNMNRAMILIASGATVALMLAGTYVMASERATTMAQLNAEAAKVQPAPAKAGVLYH